MDCRKGGSLLFRWQQNPEEFVRGTYTDVIENELIAFTWESNCGAKVQDTLVTIRFASMGPGESNFELKHTFLPSEVFMDQHHLGWACAMLDIDKYFNQSCRSINAALEAKVTRILAFAIEDVFEAWTQPKIIGQWFNRKRSMRSF